MSRSYGKSQRKKITKNNIISLDMDSYQDIIQADNNGLVIDEIKKMYHVSPRDRRASILANGLQSGHDYALTMKNMFSEEYKSYPVFLALDKEHCMDNEYLDDNIQYDIYEVDTRGMKLLPDIPALAGRGAYVDEESIWFENEGSAGNQSVPSEFYKDEAFNIHLKELVYYTGSAATYQNIDVSKIELVN